MNKRQYTYPDSLFHIASERTCWRRDCKYTLSNKQVDRHVRPTRPTVTERAKRPTVTETSDSDRVIIQYKVTFRLFITINGIFTGSLSAYLSCAKYGTLDSIFVVLYSSAKLYRLTSRSLVYAAKGTKEMMKQSTDPT